MVTIDSLTYQLLSDRIIINSKPIFFPKFILETQDEAEKKNTLLKFISNVIYTELHTRTNFELDEQYAKKNLYEKADETLIMLFELNNHGDGWIDHNWRILEIKPNGAIKAVNISNGIKVNLKPKKLINQNYSAGEIIAVKRAKSSLYTSPGYYVGISNYGMPHNAGQPITRLYANINIEGSARFISSISEFAKLKKLELYFKVSNNSRGYNRADAAVVYLSATDFKENKAAFIKLFNNLKAYLTDEVSLFCERLCFGVGLAFEEPSKLPIATISYGEKASKELARKILENDIPSMHTTKRIVNL